MDGDGGHPGDRARPAESPLAGETVDAALPGAQSARRQCRIIRVAGIFFRRGGSSRGASSSATARDLRPLAAIPLDAIPASLHTPLRGTPAASPSGNGSSIKACESGLPATRVPPRPAGTVEPGEEVARVVRPGDASGCTARRRQRMEGTGEPSTVRSFRFTWVIRRRIPQRVGVHGEVVVLAGDLHLSSWRGPFTGWLHPVVAEFQS